MKLKEVKWMSENLSDYRLQIKDNKKNLATLSMTPGKTP